MAIALGATPVIHAAPESHSAWGEWDEAHQSETQGKWDDAIKALQAHPHPEEASYFYNLGVLTYRTGNLGAAVGYFEKANRIRPHDPDIQANLRIARKAVSQTLGSGQELDNASTWVESLSDHMPMDELRGTLGLLAFIMTLMWTRSFMKTHQLRKTFVQSSGIVGLLAFGLTASLYAAQRSAQAHPPAVSLQGQVIRSGPGNQFLEIGKLKPGMTVRLLGPVSAAMLANDPASKADGTETWHQVRFTEDEMGWVPTSSLLLL